MFVSRDRFPAHRVAGVLLVAVAGLFLVMGVPRRPMSPEEAAAMRDLHGARVVLEELRGAVDDYRRDHGAWPGIAPGSGLAGRPDADVLVRQLTMATDENGRMAPETELAFPFGPYLRRIVENPANGLATVRVLEPGARPSAADGETGWIFDPLTGDVRSNAVGVGGNGEPYFDM